MTYDYDAAGNLAANSAGLEGSYSYDPYGKQLSAEPTDERSAFNPWRYAGGYYDKPTGFMKFGTRYYDPNVMRWTQRDPVMGSLANPMSLNPYGYVGGNPVAFTDLSGRLYYDLHVALKYVTVGGLWNVDEGSGDVEDGHLYLGGGPGLGGGAYLGSDEVESGFCIGGNAAAFVGGGAGWCKNTSWYFELGAGFELSLSVGWIF